MQSPHPTGQPAASDRSSAPEDTRIAKARLRREVRERRRARTSRERDEIGERLAAHLAEVVVEAGASTVACFLSTDLEPGTRPFLTWARGRGIRVLLPIAREDGLLDWVVDTGREAPNPLLNVPEPVGEPVAPIEADAAELVLVPAALVARDGTRLGWGGGYYDRVLGSTTADPLVLAIVHDDEIVDALPSDPHDIPVDGAVTPSGCVRFRG